MTKKVKEEPFKATITVEEIPELTITIASLDPEILLALCARVLTHLKQNYRQYNPKVLIQP